MDPILKSILLFNGQFFLISFLLGGYFLSNRRFFLEALCLILVTIALNSYLKFQFKMPLPPGITSPAHYGFPSGHMLVSVVMWGWLALRFRNRLFNIAVLTLLPLMGYAIVHAGYHYPFHIYGAFGFGILILFVAQLLFSKKMDIPLYAIALGFGFLSLLIIHVLPSPHRDLWIAPTVLLTISFGSGFFPSPSGTFWEKIIGLVLAMGGAFLIHVVFQRIGLPFSQIIVTCTEYASVCLWSLFCAPWIGCAVKMHRG